MLDVLEITFPIYALIGLGFVVTRRGGLSPADIRGLGRFVVSLAFPALMFSVIVSKPLGETVQIPYLLTYAVGSLLLMAMLYPGYRRVGGYDHKTAALATLGSACPNSGFIGYPVLLLAMPAVAEQTLVQNLLVEQMVFLPLLLMVTEFDRSNGGAYWRGVLANFWRIITGPVVSAMLAGVLFASAGLKVPGILDGPLQMLAVTCGATSLFVIGGNLAVLKPKGVRALAACISVAKLVLHPLIMLACVVIVTGAGVFDMPLQMRSVLVLSCGMPVMGMLPMLAQAHHREGFASAAQLGTTIASVFTLPFVLYLVG
ncbi:AEC family transporter [Sulfitobacter pontiacus]|uniref:AEC family transporter n=1 Tax=Sulfitobacter pontiacus TaxID=60137 RepID=UPI003266E85D